MKTDLQMMTVKDFAKKAGIKHETRVYAMGNEGKLTIIEVFGKKIVMIDDKAYKYIKQ